MAASRLDFSAWLRCSPFQSAVLLLLALLPADACQAERPLSVFDDQVFEEPFVGDGLGESAAGDAANAAQGSWENLAEDGPAIATWDDPGLTPSDCACHLGLRCSSTHGRHIGRGLPLEGTSWLNRPYHVDWFSGPLLGDDLVKDRVAQDNELFGGFRIGWDFDHYWGMEARFGWADPNVQFNEPQPVADNGSYFVSDIDFVYYPWGDSKIRPYLLLGAGLARIDFVDQADVNFNTTLFTLPFGGGVQFRQWPWLAWRLEVLDNLSMGADGVNTMHNVSLTAGMEFRFGSRPASYWPWRSSRTIW